MGKNHVLVVEEQALHGQEQALIEMEAQLFEQELGVAQMEKAFKRRNKALLNLAAYVGDQEASLVRRAELMGSKAKALVDSALATSDEAEAPTMRLGQVEERAVLLERRRELLAARMQVVEEREGVYMSRHEAMESAEGAVADLEQRLLGREKDISDALRQLISQSTSLTDDDDDDDDDDDSDDDDPEPAASTTSKPVVSTPSAAAQPSRAESRTSEGAHIGTETVQVTGGNSSTKEDTPTPIGVNTAGVDRVTRRRKGRARARTNQFRITLEAQMGTSEPHDFFAYQNDSPEDIPGVFIATPNLLKVGREVRVRIGIEGEDLEATGIVAWRRQRGEAGGPPGMGIELLTLDEIGRQSVVAWVSTNPAQVI